MIINGADLVAAAPFKVMAQQKHEGPGGVSWGLGEAGYDIRIEQDIHFSRYSDGERVVYTQGTPSVMDGRFVLASAIEEFQMPDNLVGIVHDKSTWARQGLSVFNTVIEPGWKGFLTLELVYHGEGDLIIPAGSGIAQVVFHQTSLPANYSGKYQNQPNHPVEAIRSKG